MQAEMRANACPKRAKNAIIIKVRLDKQKICLEIVDGFKLEHNNECNERNFLNVE